jgi:thioredoxin 2
MHIVCSQCGAINRIPQDKRLFSAKCGKCSGDVYTGSPVKLNDADFFRYIEKNHLPIIVDFFADWCGPCKSMAPVFASLAAESEGLLFAKVDTEASQQISSQAGIRSLPTLVFFHQGVEVDRVSGALREPQLKQWIMQCLGKLKKTG